LLKNLFSAEEHRWTMILSMVLTIAVCCSLPTEASHEAPSEQEAGWNLVKERCYLCHYLDRAEVKFGPSLKGLFQREKLMSGKPVNDRTVSAWIAEGSANMPAFRHTLTPQQIQLIVKFLKQGSAANVPMLHNSR
jgi:mono/diheme cytochrome c family protein